MTQSESGPLPRVEHAYLFSLSPLVVSFILITASFSDTVSRLLSSLTKATRASVQALFLQGQSKGL